MRSGPVPLRVSRPPVSLPPARAVGSSDAPLSGLAWAAAAGLGVVALAVAGWAQAAAGAGAALAAVGAVALLRRLAGPSGAPADVAAAPAAATAPGFDDALERLSDPVLIVGAGEPDDMASRRVLFANEAARTLLRIPAAGALLVNAVRRPEALEAADEALYGRRIAAADYADTGAQARAWRLHATPLPSAPEAPAALLHLRDETDARRSARMGTDFLANASHELRTPLASLSGFIETLRGHARDDPAARDRFLAVMADQADRMTRLTADLLHLSRVELNEHVPPSGRVDLALAAADVADALQPQSAALGVAIALRAPAMGEVTVAGDRDQVVQVVQNLVDNALKHSPFGATVRVEVVASAGELPPEPTRPRHTLVAPDRSEGARYAALRVSDDGVGMVREELPRLAERFYRVGGQKSGPRAGTGLGLAIVRHIVNRHRGGLVVESAPDAGSAFTVTLPAA